MRQDPRNRARRRTGANKIPVNWEPPSQVPQGVTAKSAPPRKPSPSPMGPVGRGRPTPAWQKAEGAAPASAVSKCHPDMTTLGPFCGEVDGHFRCKSKEWLCGCQSSSCDGLEMSQLEKLDFRDAV
eukprot:symbB.v1.2.009753.t1/scaffold622.1/size179608/1